MAQIGKSVLTSVGWNNLAQLLENAGYRAGNVQRGGILNQDAANIAYVLVQEPNSRVSTGFVTPTPGTTAGALGQNAQWTDQNFQVEGVWVYTAVAQQLYVWANDRPLGL